MDVGSYCNILQYRLLKRCSKLNDMSLWNWYRERYSEHKIFLMGAYLKDLNLKKANLFNAKLNGSNLVNADFRGAIMLMANFSGARLNNSNFYGSFLSLGKFKEADLARTNFQKAILDMATFCKASLEEANLQESILTKADLRDSWLRKANLQGAELDGANLRNAHMENTNLQEASLRFSNLQGANLENANLSNNSFWGTSFRKAMLWKTVLQNSKFISTNFQEAMIGYAELEDAKFLNTNLQNATIHNSNLQGTLINTSTIQDTIFNDNTINTKTDFSGSNIQEAIMPPELEAQLEYNIRRKSWKKWMHCPPIPKDSHRISRAWHRTKQIPHLIVVNLIVRPFWWISDYGTSSTRLLLVFFFLSLLFGVIYWMCPWCVLGLKEKTIDGEIFEVPKILLPLRAFYFSVVTMTTLGFGDIHADPRYWQGHVLLTIQVLLGYFLLGALVTRFGIMFISKAPCPKVPRADMDKWHYPIRQLWKRIRGKGSSSNG